MDFFGGGWIIRRGRRNWRRNAFWRCCRTCSGMSRGLVFAAYLYGIAIHLVAAERRKAGREVAENEKLDGRAAEGNAAENNDAGIWVRSALGHLEQSERDILMLREYEQLSYGEIAAVLRMPVNTVRSRLFRARAALKNQLLPVK